MGRAARAPPSAEASWRRPSIGPVPSRWRRRPGPRTCGAGHGGVRGVGRRAGHPGARDPSHRDAHMRSGPEAPVAVALVCTILAGLGLAAVYWLGGQPQIEGGLLAVALRGLGAALILWERRLMPHEQVEEQRELASPAEERAAAQAALERGGEEIGRRRFLARLLGAAAAALGLAALFPIRSLGRAP